MNTNTICSECGNKSGNWIFKKTERRYCGDGYDFTIEVDLPYCDKCGALVYDSQVEDKIREKAHSIIGEFKFQCG